MRKKIFTFLLALTASVGLMNAAVDGTLSGAFTVDGSGTQVYFSQGNLQYVGGNWQFAENQWDVIGASQTNSSRDLFGWGTGNNPNQTSEEYEDYTTFADWGSNMGGDWRTLTSDEWLYIFNTRTSASDLRGAATVCGVHGYIILPDNFVLPGGLSWTPRPNDWTTNEYTSQKWSSMEENGAVFLPAAGYREGTTVHYDESAWGYYWSATEHAKAYYAYNVWVADENDYVRVYYRDRTYGHSVRLVSETAPSTPKPSWVRDGDDWDDATKTLTVNSNPGQKAYQSITEIQHVVINNSVTSMDSEVFRYCTGLTSVTIPNSVTSIGYQVFNGCTGLTSVTIPNGITSIPSSLFYNCSSLTSVTIPNSVTSIGNSAFFGCTGLTSVTIPNSVTSIDMQAFKNCTGLTEVTIPNSVTSIEYFAFDGCTNVTDMYCYPLAADLTWNIANNSFKANKATQCHVFASELSAYQDKFASVRVTFVGDLPAPTPHPHGECGAQGNNLLWDLDPSTGVLTITGSGAMYDWASDTERPWYSLRAQITSVVLPSGITSLGKYAFRGTDIVSINMTENYPAGLTTINQEAFFSTQLTSVTIPESVVTIGMDAFRESKTITDVYCYADPNNLTWNDYWCDDFKNADHATVCHVKACALSTYEANWGGTPYNVFNSTGVNVTFVGDLPGDCPAPTPTPTDEQVPTNADPENPSYHYSTFFHSTQNYKLTNDGTQAFIATLSNNDLVLTKIAEGTQVIPANTAVIFRKSGSEAPVVLNPTEENGVSVNPDDNSLKGVDDETAITSIDGLTATNCYVLSGTPEHGVGFYKIKGNTLKAHKAYVIYNGSAAPKRMRFIFNQEQTATGMEDVQGSVQTTKILRNGQIIIIRNGVEYTINGQKVK